MAGTYIRVHTLTNGPFRGRAYEVREDGTLGRRVRAAEPHRSRGPQRDAEDLVARVREIPDQAALDAILMREPNLVERRAMFDLWRPILAFDAVFQDGATVYPEREHMDPIQEQGA